MKGSIEEVFELYNVFGNANYIGENISQLEHATQAAIAAQRDNQPCNVVIAAFLHDIGHLLKIGDLDEQMGQFGVKSHEKIGATFLREYGFPEDICKMVESHVKAKKYLAGKYPDYVNRLSIASQSSLKFQGGPMNEVEMREFENDPLFDSYIKLREYDDIAKDDDKSVLEEIDNMNPTKFYYTIEIRNLDFNNIFFEKEKCNLRELNKYDIFS